MNIRTKLLILLLAIALVPIILGAAMHTGAMCRVAHELARAKREDLSQTLHGILLKELTDYGCALKHHGRTLDLAVRHQARAVEQLLAEPPPDSPQLFFCEDYDTGKRLPTGMVASDRHRRTGPDGEASPIEVTYDEQVYFCVKGVDRKAIADDLARLSKMPEVYRTVYQSHSDVVYWQYTALESGVHMSYPGHGGYPPDYDPRRRAWYQKTKEKGDVEWDVMYEVSTGNLAVAAAMPVYRSDGSFAGVTAIDIAVTALFDEMDLPDPWAADAEILVTFRDTEGEAATGKLVVIARSGLQRGGSNWQKPVEMELLELDDPEEQAEFMKDVLDGNAGVRRVRYRGRDVLWAYGEHEPDEALPVVTVPYDKIAAAAGRVEQRVLRRARAGLVIRGALSLGVSGIVILIAVWASQSVTRPVSHLAEAATKLAEGDYGAQVDIRTGDELEDLGHVFNDVAPKLEERERMKQSLELAKEIQQNLLPQQPPQLDGFDIAGQVVYCDETGGDYYDFIELVELGSGKLGVAVGDVTGHGIGPALLMATARGVLRSHAALHGPEVGKLLSTLNTHLVKDTHEGRFMTLFYALLDSEARSFCYASGGHDPALWFRQDEGRIEELRNTGMLLGVFDEGEFGTVGPTRMAEGDVVVVTTDGIPEAHDSADRLFGRERLSEVVTAHAGESAGDLHKAIMQSVADFSGDVPRRDDITLVVIKAS